MAEKWVATAVAMVRGVSWRAVTAAAALVLASLAQAQSLDELRKQLKAPWDAKDWPAAEVVARRITGQPQSDASDWRNLVAVLRQQKKDAEACAARQELVKRPGARSDDHNGICWYLLERNQPLQARPACQQAVDLNPDNYAAQVNLGHTYLLAGDKAQAQDAYRKTIQIITKDEDLAQGPLDDFKLFIQNGWSAADAQAARQWFELTWPRLKALRDARTEAGRASTADPGQAMKGLQQLLALRAQVVATVGEGLDADRCQRAYVRLIRGVVGDLIDTKHQYAAAIAFVDMAMQSAGQALPDDGRWAVLGRLAVSLEAAEQLALALPARERILAERQATLGADHPDTLTSMNNLAFTYGRLGQHDKALALEEKVLAARTTKLGADHPDTLTSMSNLASTYGKLGQHDQALALNEKVLAARTTKLGADHPDTLTSMSNTAHTFSAMRWHTRSDALYIDVIGRSLRNPSVDPKSTAGSIGDYILSLRERNQPTPLLEGLQPDMKKRVDSYLSESEGLRRLSNMLSEFGRKSN